MLSSKYSLATAAITLFAAVGCSDAFAPAGKTFAACVATTFGNELNEATKNENVFQTEDTKLDKVMTFSYDMSLEPKYENPTYPGIVNGLSGDEGEFDVIVIRSGMGGLACGAISAKYGDKILVLESHIKVGGSAHTFTRVHNGEKHSFEVGPFIFVDWHTLVLDTGVSPNGSKSKFEDLLMEQAKDGPKAVAVRIKKSLFPIIHYSQTLKKKRNLM